MADGGRGAWQALPKGLPEERLEKPRGVPSNKPPAVVLTSNLARGIWPCVVALPRRQPRHLCLPPWWPVGGQPAALSVLRRGGGAGFRKRSSGGAISPLYLKCGRHRVAVRASLRHEGKALGDGLGPHPE